MDPYNMRYIQEWAEGAGEAQRYHPYDGGLGRVSEIKRHSPSHYLCKNLIINYLPQNFTDKNLFDMFVPFGPLHSVKIMREAKSGYSYGFGFANFIREEDAYEALRGLNGFQVENKRLKVSFARPPSDDIKDTNVYITNLPRGTTEKDLVALFSQFGTIVQKNLLHDKNTGRSRGTAFVRYDHRDQAASAISMMNHFIPPGATEALRVKLAQDHGKQKAAYLAGFQDALFNRAPSGIVFK